MNSHRRGLLIFGVAAVGVTGYGTWSLWKKREALREVRALQLERGRQVDALARIETAGLVDKLGMPGFLAFWNENVLKRLKAARFPLDRVQEEIVASGTLFLPPARADEVAFLQQRLGTELPASYIQLLVNANGVKSVIDYARQPLDFHPAFNVNWLHDAEKEFVDTWLRHPIDVSDSVYSNYGPTQDPVKFRSKYLERMVAVGPMVDGGIYLLNPEVRFANGEMEAWDLSTKYPGAKRYQSFARLLEQHARNTCWNLDYWSLSHGWERPRK